MIDKNKFDKSKKLPTKAKWQSDVYISYNSLSSRGELRSVSQAMRNYIKEGFAKIESTTKDKH